MKDILKIAFILFVVCGLAAGSLSFVNLATKDRIAAFAKEEKFAAFQKIFPAAQSFTERPPADGGEVRESTRTPCPAKCERSSRATACEGASSTTRPPARATSTATVVGVTPSSRTGVPSSALTNALFPELNSPTTTRRNSSSS